MFSELNTRPGLSSVNASPCRLQVSEEGWLKLVTRFSRLFRRSAGTPPSLDREAQKHGRRREGLRISRSVFL